MIYPFATTLTLPTPSSREAVRRTMDADVQDFLARGGKIQHIPRGQSADSIVSYQPPGSEESRSRGASNTAANKRTFWSKAMLATLRQSFGKVSDIELATQLGVTPGHLRHKASHLGLIREADQEKEARLKTAQVELRKRWHTSTRTELAKELGISIGTAYRMAKEMGLTNPGQRAHV